MTSRFDPPIERRGSDSLKWQKYADAAHDVIGAWVADLDLPTAEPVIDAVRKRLDERVFGYSEPPDDFLPVVMQRLEEKFGWKIAAEWIVVQPGVVPSLFFASCCTGNPGDVVMAARPNYHYLLKTGRYTARSTVPVDCRISNGRWALDFDQMRRDISDRTSVFLLCNPHNPVGRVLDRSELEQIAEICLASNAIICADEIHAELVLDQDKRHIPIASLSPEVAQNTITLFSASKTFNLPGIGGLSFAVIPDPDLRAAYNEVAFGRITHPGALAYAATTAAYRDGDDWLGDLLDYLRANRDYLETEISRMDGLSMTHVEGTFLAWINVADAGLKDPFNDFLKGGVALSDGEEMGRSDYLRLNFGCHRTTLEEIIRRMKSTLASG